MCYKAFHFESLLHKLHILKTSFASVINIYIFYVLAEKFETNIHLEQPLYLLTKNWW